MVFACLCLGSASAACCLDPASVSNQVPRSRSFRLGLAHASTVMAIGTLSQTYLCIHDPLS